jgi:hypothetical protein
MTRSKRMILVQMEGLAAPVGSLDRGRALYNADLIRRPTYHTGEPRKTWDELRDHERNTWAKPRPGEWSLKQ